MHRRRGRYSFTITVGILFGLGCGVIACGTLLGISSDDAPSPSPTPDGASDGTSLPDVVVEANSDDSGSCRGRFTAPFDDPSWAGDWSQSLPAAGTTITLASGHTGSSLHFTAAKQNAISLSRAVGGGCVLEVDAWIRRTSGSENRVTVMRLKTSSTHTIDISTIDTFIDIESVAVSAAQVPGTFTMGDFHHIVFRYDPMTGQAGLSLDGLAEVSVPLSSDDADVPDASDRLPTELDLGIIVQAGTASSVDLSVDDLIIQ